MTATRIRPHCSRSIALAFAITAAPALIARASPSSAAPEKLSDAELERVAAGDLLGLDLGSILNGLGLPAFGQGAGSNLGLAAGPLSAQASLQALVPLVQSVANLTALMIQQAQALSIQR
ncbi:MAG: hypothetical protein ACJ783_05990 [Myxococcales bacterium]